MACPVKKTAIPEDLRDPWHIARLLVLAAVYFGASKFGFSLAFVAEQVTVIWPPTGIALAAVLLLGNRMWPGIMLGAFLTNVTAHEPVITALSIATGNTLEALVGAWLLRQYAGDGQYLERIKGILGLTLFAAGISTMISATIGATSLCLSGLQSWTDYDSLWLTWWMGDAGGALIVAPLLLAWCRGPYSLPSLNTTIEALILTAAAIITNLIIFINPTLTGTVRTYPYMVFPVVIWTAMRFGQRGVTLMILAISGVAVWATAHGLGPFTNMPMGQALTVLQTFTMIMAVTGLTMRAAMSERFETEKQLMEDRIRSEKTQGFLSSLVESSDEGIIGETLDGTISTWNLGAEKLFGYTAAEAIGQKIDLIVPPDKQEEESHILARLQKGERAEHIETVRVRKNGQRVDVLLTLSPILDIKGKIIGASKVLHDITQRKEVEKTILRYTNELRRSNQELDDFAYIASHDLKEPLRGLLTQIAFLLEDYQEKLDMDGIRRLRRLMFLSQRMDKLISDLLYFSRLGRTELAVQEIDPNETIAEVRQMMDTFLKEHNAQLTVPHPMPRTVCDKLRIAEVFRNLITNAVKYNDKSVRLVEVGYLESAKAPHGEEKNVFYVRDNGVGIEPEFHEAIFRIFKRLQNPAVKGEEGTGSGLTFVKKIIERHKGHIWLESESGKGSTFYFTLGGKNL